MAAITLLFFFSCNKAPKMLWQPNKQILAESGGFSLPREIIDRDLLAELATKAVIDAKPNLVKSPLKPIGEGLPLHPSKGPFFFENEDVLVAIAEDTTNIWVWLSQMNKQFSGKEVIFMPLLGEQTEGKLSISTKNRSLSFIEANDKLMKIEESQATGKIRLTPEKMAEMLSHFNQWEGIHLDIQKNKLDFIGSNASDNPQISVSDLIAAYNAIFVHEAAGEALFVDMDFGDGDKDYKVTFGGGFEDTRPGKVLLEADLLLKALSSGIDPWTNEKPLVQQMCYSGKKTPFQEAFCKYVNPFILKNKGQTNEVLYEAGTIYANSESEAKLIVDFSLNADESSQEAWDYVFFATDFKKDKILNEVLSQGYFNYTPTFNIDLMVEELMKDGRFKNIPKNILFEYLKTNEMKSLVSESTPCACVPKPYKFAIHNCEDDCDRIGTLELVNKIFALTVQQKSIVQEARRFNKERDRRLYATLAFMSPQVHEFLRSQPRASILEVFAILEKMEGQVTSENHEGLFANLAVLYFMSQDKNFTEAFLKLGEEDKLILAFVAARMMMSSDFAKMVNQLQFHNPLCECRGCEIPESVESMEDAFVKFVCKHLKKYPRTYLANLIRKEVKSEFEYLTADEFRSLKHTPLGEGVHTTRYWFFPGNEVLVVDSSITTFLFNRPNMIAKAERLNTRRGPYESVEYDDEIPGVQENLDLVNANYNELSEIFPTLKELNNLIRMLSFFRWIRDYHPYKFDLSAFAEAVDYGTPTPRKYPVYETVIALPGGGLLRAVGGVDLHSNTQVRIDQEKIDNFLSAMVSVKDSKSFVFDNKTFEVLGEFTLSGGLERESTQVFQNGQKQLDVKENNGLLEIYFAEDGKLQWSLVNEVDPFESTMTVSTTYSKGERHRASRNATNATETEHWIISRSDSTLAASKKQIGGEANGEPNVEKNIDKPFTEWLNMGLPFDAIWQLLSMRFDNARLVSKNGMYLFSYFLKGEEKNLLAREKEPNVWYTQPITAKESIHFLNTHSVAMSNKNINIRGIQLISTIPGDNIFISQDGFKHDSPLQVRLLNNKLSTYSISEWSALTRAIASTLFKNEKSDFVFFQPLLREKKKGSYESFELTNRPFLVETVANLNATHSGKGKRFGLLNFPASGSLSINPEEIWEAPRKRKYIFDLEGFSEPCRQQLFNIATSSPKNTVVFDKGTTIQPLPVSSDNPDEVIWITTLSEKEATERLEVASSKGWLKGVLRLRIFNVNNSVYSLGGNLFVENVNLQIIGAWQRIIDFETLLPLLQKMVLNDKSLELDKEIADHVASIRKEYKKNLTAMQLRIMRSFDDFLFVWEEASPPRGTDISSWKIFNKVQPNEK